MVKCKISYNRCWECIVDVEIGWKYNEFGNWNNREWFFVSNGWYDKIFMYFVRIIV